MIGSRSSAGGGRDALPRIRRRMSIGREQQKGLQRLTDSRRRSRGSATLPRHSRRNACLTRRAGARGSASL